jgi:hypothetical protein
VQNGDVIALLKTLTFVGDAGQSWATDWVHFPAAHRQCQLAVITKSRTGASVVQVQLQTSFDTDTIVDVGAPVPTPVPGTCALSDIATGLGPMVRLLLSAGGANTLVTLSVYLTPKVS